MTTESSYLRYLTCVSYTFHYRVFEHCWTKQHELRVSSLLIVCFGLLLKAFTLVISRDPENTIQSYFSLTLKLKN
jgi:hypothetical protein